MIRYHKRSVQKRGQKRTSKYDAKAKNARGAKASETNRFTYEITRQPRADKCFARVADEPAQNHQRWNVTLQLRRPMRRKRSQQEEPPDAGRREQKPCDENGIRRPKHGDRMRLKGQR